VEFYIHIPYKVSWYGISCSGKTTPLLLHQLISFLTILQSKPVTANVFKTLAQPCPPPCALCLSLSLSHSPTHTMLPREFMFTTGWVTSENMEELNRLMQNYLFFFVIQWLQKKTLINENLDNLQYNGLQE
jgi:hypothetical protein